MLYPEYGDFEEQTGALIKVVGVGGGGGNAVNHMVANMVQQEFMVISWAKVQLIAKNTVKSYSMR